MDADEAMRGISAIARGDVRKLFDQNNQLLPVHQWSDDIAVCVKSIKRKAWGMEIVLHDALRAREIIATATGRLGQRHEDKHTFDHAAYPGAEPPAGDEE